MGSIVSNTIAIAVILLFVALIAFVSIRTAIERLKAQPGYTSQRELEALRGVIAMAFQAKGIPVISLRSINSYDPPYRDLWLLENRFRRAKLLPGTVLTRDNIALIAPFVERWLAGDLPHLLSAEYDNEIGVPLARYKERMQAQELWPRPKLA